MGIAPLPEEPIPDETGYSPLAQKKPRESEGYEAFEEELEGDEGPYGSLVMLRPKSFKKKPVLTVDPDELEKAYQAFDLIGAQIMEGGDTAAPRPGTNFLGLAPIEDGEEAIESDDDVVADDDLDRLLQNALHSEEGFGDEGVPVDDTGFDAPDASLQFPGAPAEPTFDSGTNDVGVTETPMDQPVVDGASQRPVDFTEGEASATPEPEPAEERAAEPPIEPLLPEEPVHNAAPEVPARPSFSLPEFRSEPKTAEPEDQAHYGDGWRLVPPEPEESFEQEHIPHEAPVEELGFEEPVADENDYGTTTYYEDEEEVFDPFAAPSSPRLAQVQETGTRSQLRARLLRDEQQAVEETHNSGFSLFGWLRRLFG